MRNQNAFPIRNAVSQEKKKAAQSKKDEAAARVTTFIHRRLAPPVSWSTDILRREITSAAPSPPTETNRRRRNLPPLARWGRCSGMYSSPGGCVRLSSPGCFLSARSRNYLFPSLHLPVKLSVL